MKTDWQDYENITYEPKSITAVEVKLAKEKPQKNDNGFIMKNNFEYKQPTDGTRLWIRFWIAENEIYE